MVKLWLNIAKEKDIVTFMERFNMSYKRFFENGSWYMYFFSLVLILISVYYFNLDVRKKKLLLQRRREIRRENERPPQKRRPGAALKDHEIYRVVYGKVQEYLDPLSLEKYKIHLNKNGEIVGITNTNVKTVSLDESTGNMTNPTTPAAVNNTTILEN